LNVNELFVNDSSSNRPTTTKKGRGFRQMSRLKTVVPPNRFMPKGVGGITP